MHSYVGLYVHEIVEVEENNYVKNDSMVWSQHAENFGWRNRSFTGGLLELYGYAYT